MHLNNISKTITRVLSKSKNKVSHIDKFEFRERVIMGGVSRVVDSRIYDKTLESIKKYYEKHIIKN